MSAWRVQLPSRHTVASWRSPHPPSGPGSILRIHLPLEYQGFLNFQIEIFLRWNVEQCTTMYATFSHFSLSTPMEEYFTYIPTAYITQKNVSTKKTTTPSNPRDLADVQIQKWKSFSTKVVMKYKPKIMAMPTNGLLLPVFEKYLSPDPCANEVQVEIFMNSRLFQPVKRLLQFIGIDSAFSARPQLLALREKIVIKM